MKKRVFAIALCVCLLVAAFTVNTNAALISIDSDILSTVRICPGKTIEDGLDAPEVFGPIYAQGWEILTSDGIWVPYGGVALDEGVVQVRYFITDASGDEYYSNVCEVTVKHNPKGDYQYDGINHWHICDDCGGQADKGAHTTLDVGMDDAAVNNKVCQVCGQVRTSQYTGFLAFWAWIINLVVGLIS